MQSEDYSIDRCTSATPRPRGWFAAVSIASIWLFGPILAPAAGQEKIDWKTGVEFRKQLETTVGVNWGDNPLRDALGRLARTQGTAIFLDRRVDPDQRVAFTSRDQPLEIALVRLCGELELAKSALGSVVYIGPQGSADKVATVAALRRQEASALPAAAKARWLKQAPMAWPELTTPNQLLAQLAREGSFSINGELPHDVWPAYDLPAMPLADRLSLVLAGFGLTYRIEQNGSAVTLTTIPDDIEYEKSYSRGDPARLAAELKRLMPDLKIGRRNNEVVVRGPYEEHEKIERMLRGERVKTVTPAPGEKRYTLKVENQPAGAVATTVAKEIGKKLTYDPSALPKLKEKVTFSVTDVPLDQLLKATLEPLGLRAEVGEETLNIVEID